MDVGGGEERRRVSDAYDRLLGDESAARWNRENPGNAAILAERTRRLSALLAERDSTDQLLRLLDFGAGASTTLCPELDDSNPDAPQRTALDILFDRLRSSADVTDAAQVCGDGQALPFPTETFDVVTSFTVFSSVLDHEIQGRIARELTRVLRPGGFVLWYDMRYRNPLNPNIRPLGRRTIDGLFPDLRRQLSSITVLPPLARRLIRGTDHLYPVAAAIPPLRSHLIGTLTKPLR